MAVDRYAMPSFMFHLQCFCFVPFLLFYPSFFHFLFISRLVLLCASMAREFLHSGNGIPSKQHEHNLINCYELWFWILIYGMLEMHIYSFYINVIFFCFCFFLVNDARLIVCSCVCVYVSTVNIWICYHLWFRNLFRRQI